MGKILGLLVLLVSIGGGAYYLGLRQATTEAPAAVDLSNVPAPAPFATTTRPIAVAQIAIYKGYFDPATTTVKKGTEVVWTNKDSILHTVTSDEGGLILNSQAIAAGHSFAHVFDTVGTVRYHCAVDPTMHSTIIVTE